MELYTTKYICDSHEDIWKYLDTYGIAIIPSILSLEECNQTINGMWNFLEHITSESSNPIKRNDETTWRNISLLYPLHSMLIQHYSIGHAQFIWNIRQNPKIIDIFSKLYNVTPEELLVSFDGASFHLPPETTNKGWYRKTWFHVDQSFTKKGLKCIQGWVNAFETNPGDATITILETSHKFHEEFASTFSISDKSDWYKFTETELQFYNDRNCIEQKISCPRGSLVLWDSRLVHCGTEPLKQRPERNFRCVIYVCYQPREYTDTKNLKKKQKAFNELRTTSHWSSKVILFPKVPRTYGGEIPIIKPIEKPILNELGMKLAGF